MGAIGVTNGTISHASPPPSPHPRQTHWTHPLCGHAPPADPPLACLPFHVNFAQSSGTPLGNKFNIFGPWLSGPRPSGTLRRPAYSLPRALLYPAPSYHPLTALSRAQAPTAPLLSNMPIDSVNSASWLIKQLGPSRLPPQPSLHPAVPCLLTYSSPRFPSIPTEMPRPLGHSSCIHWHLHHNKRIRSSASAARMAERLAPMIYQQDAYSSCGNNTTYTVAHPLQTSYTPSMASSSDTIRSQSARTPRALNSTSKTIGLRRLKSCQYSERSVGSTPNSTPAPLTVIPPRGVHISQPSQRMNYLARPLTVRSTVGRAPARLTRNMRRRTCSMP